MSDPDTLDADTFRFSIEPRIAAPFHDGATDHVVDTVDGRVVAVVDSHDRAVAVQEAIESAHDVGVAARHALGQPTDPVPLTRLGDVLRESVAGVLARPAVVVPFGQVDASEKARADAEANRAAEMEAQANAEKDRADAAERMVCEVRAIAEEAISILDANTCRHENTERQGVIWEACTDCGARWADDRGGRPESGGHDGHRIDGMRAALVNTAEVAGRWVPLRKYEAMEAAWQSAREAAAHLSASSLRDTPVLLAAVEKACAERDAAIAARDEAVTRAEAAEKVNADSARDAEEVTRDVIARLEKDRLRYEAAERARDEAVKDRLFAEGERDAARDEVEDLREHLDAANAAHLECEAELAKARESIAELDRHWLAKFSRETSARDEVGIQLAAAQERLRQSSSTIETMWAAVVDRSLATFDAASAMRARWDTVPGDALAPVVKVCQWEKTKGKTATGTTLCCPDDDGKFTPCLRNCGLARLCDLVGGEWRPMVPPSPAGVSGQPSGSTPAASSATASSSDAVRALIDAARAVDRCYDAGSSIRRPMYALREALDGLRITAALEASGIDSANVKGVE